MSWEGYWWASVRLPSLAYLSFRPRNICFPRNTERCYGASFFCFEFTTALRTNQRVIGVADGDTITVPGFNRVPQRVRLVGIDAPVEELVKLLGIAKQQAQQYNPDEHRDPKRRLLCVPLFRLPH